MASNDEMMACVKMLKARGGALDLKAVEVISSALEELHNTRSQMEGERQRMMATIELTERANTSRADGNDELRTQLDKAQRAVLFLTKQLADKGKEPSIAEGSQWNPREIAAMATADVRNVLVDALADSDVIVFKDQTAADVARVLAAEYRGAVHELKEVVDKLRFVARDDDDLTPFLVADAAAEEIKKHRSACAGRLTVTIGGANGQIATFELPGWVLKPGDIHNVSLVGNTVTITTIAALPPERQADYAAGYSSGTGAIAAAYFPGIYVQNGGADHFIDFRTVNTGSKHFDLPHPEDMTKAEQQREIDNSVLALQIAQRNEELRANIKTELRKVLEEMRNDEEGEARGG